MTRPLDLIIPVYNESPQVVLDTVRAAREAFASSPAIHLRVIVVDDGSREPIPASTFAGLEGVDLVRQEPNRGYGAALKTGILHGDAPWIAIADADGTYPLADLPKLAAAMEHADTVVGVRTGAINQTQWLRRFPKKVLNRFASYLAGRRIVDLNSGMRVFTRDLADYLWNLFPPGFSFTSTLTMGSLSGGFRVVEIPINYFKRTGASSIAPVKDTVRFFRLAARLGLLFSPMRIFTPIALLMLALGAAKGFGVDYRHNGYVGNLSVALMVSAVQVFLMGLLGELVVLSRKINRR